MTYKVRTIVIAVSLALIAALLTTFYVSNYKRSVQREQETVKVLVAKNNIPAGTPGADIVAKHLLVTHEVARKAVVPGAISTPAQIKTEFVTQPIYTGEQVTAHRFASASARGIRSQLTGTQRAYQLAGDSNQLLLGTLKVGDRVDLVSNLKIDPQTDIFAARVVLRNLKVLKLSGGSSAGSKLTDGPSGAAHWVMLAVTDSQAPKLIFATNTMHRWSLELRPPLHDEDSPNSVEEMQSVLTDGVRGLGNGHDFAIRATYPWFGDEK